MAGGGVGEAMLIGAAVGAGTGGIMSAVQDKDPLEGALLGAAMGAAGGGIGSGIGGLASGASTGAGTGAATGASGGATGSVGAAGVSSGAGSQAATLAAQNAGMGLTGAEQTAALLGTTNAQAGSQAATLAAQNAGMGLTPAESAANIISSTTPGTTSFAGANPASWGAQGLGQGFAPSLTNAQAYGAGAGGGIMGLVGASNQQEQWAPEEEPYSGSLSYFKYNPQTFQPSVAPGYADGGIASVYGMARGGPSNLGHYSDGGRMLRGPGDGMSDDIPGVIAGKQPARLADGEFVVPADVVSHLGNGSTDAGAKKLYGMMDNVRKARTGSKKQGRQIKADKYIPGMADGGIARFANGGFSEYSSASVDPAIYEDEPAWASSLRSELEQSKTKPIAGVSQKFTPSGFDPNYYNPQYYQDLLSGAQSKLSSAQDAYNQASQGVADYRTNYANIDRELAASQPQLNEWYLKYLGRDVDPNARLNIGNEAAIANSEEAKAWANNPLNQQYLAAQADIDAANQVISQAQPNIERLESSGIKYDPYTTASRPSASEPQFYGNIYQPSYENYSSPGYSLAGNLGQWSNVATQEAPPQRAPEKTEQVENKRRGGIASLLKGRA